MIVNGVVVSVNTSTQVAKKDGGSYPAQNSSTRTAVMGK